MYRKKYYRKRRPQKRFKYYNKKRRKSFIAELRFLLYNIIFVVLLVLFFKLFGISNLGSISLAIIGRLTFWLVGRLMGKN